MTSSSRTPEGSPGRCPVCDTVMVEPSALFGDAPCPRCGQLLWFLHLGDETRFFTDEMAQPYKERLLELVERQRARRPAGLSSRDAAELGIDSLELVELVMELEELGYDPPPDEE